MAKKMKRILVLVLALVLCIVQTIVPVLAEEAAEGTTTTTTVTETTTTDPESGNVTVEVTVHEKTTTDNAEDPVQYECEESTTTVTVTDEDGKRLSKTDIVEGTETTITEEADNGEASGQPEINVDLVPGATTEGEASTTTVTGDVKEGEDDKEYSSTTTIEVERTAEATTSEGKIVVENSGDGDFDPIQTDRDMIYVEENQLHTHSKTSYKQTYTPSSDEAMNNTKPEEGGYDFLFYGQGQMSDFYVGTEDGAGNTAHSGALQFELMQNPEWNNTDKKFDNEVEKDRFTAYCVDLTTGAQAGYWYRLDNLEDAGYYDEEAASHIRSIATSGYWGTEAGEDSNAPAVGSLEKLKKEMKAVADQIGLTEEQIDAITPGQALAATQAAIWNYANATTDGSFVDEERLIITGYKAPTVPTADDFAKAQAVYEYLLNLEPTAKTESTEIIDQDSFIKEDSMSITIGDMAADEEANKDDDQSNNVYDVAVNFALVVTPSANGDDLIVQVIGANGEIAAQGRIAGDSSNDENFNDLDYDDATGIYSLKGLTLAENSDFSFDLKLTGAQYLQEGVYIFTSEERNDVSSQTFVGLAEGMKGVNVSQSFIVNFDVDENNTTTVVNEWRSERTRNYGGGNGGGNNPGGNVPQFNVVLTANGATAVLADDALEILDEEVPLAAAPQTGDNSIVYVLMSLISLCGIVLLAKKRCVA